MLCQWTTDWTGDVLPGGVPISQVPSRPISPCVQAAILRSNMREQWSFQDSVFQDSMLWLDLAATALPHIVGRCLTTSILILVHITPELAGSGRRLPARRLLMRYQST